MRPLSALPLLLVLPALPACEAVDEVLETLTAEGPYGALLEFDPASLPEGVDPEDVSIEEVADALPDDLPAAVLAGFSPHIRMLPDGIVLSSPATLVVPVGSWTDAPARNGAREDPWSTTDPVTQANLKVLGDAPAVAMANLYQANAQALGMAFHNATTAQQSANVVAQAATTQGVATLYGVDTSSTSESIAKILNGCGQPAWNGFASDPAGASHLQQNGISPISQGQHSSAAGGNGARDSHVEYRGFTWVQSANGEWDAQVRTTVFDTFGLVKLRLDSDGNGIHDVMEGPEDSDGDGVWNPEDWDNDGDRLADEVELWFDDDEDGLPALNDPDRDGDGTLDGVADCTEERACACGFRAEGARVLCAEGDDVLCEDGDFGAGDWEFEIVPVACPDPEPGEGATCTSNGGIPLHHYGPADSTTGALFCGECAGGSVEPAGYCAPPVR